MIGGTAAGLTVTIRPSFWNPGGREMELTSVLERMRSVGGSRRLPAGCAEESG